MSAAVCLMFYVAVLAWASPALLRSLGGPGLAPRLIVGAWLTAMASTLTAWAVALSLLLFSVVSSVHDASAVRLCLRIIGQARHIDVPGQRPATALVVTAAVIATAVTGCRVLRGTRRLRAKSYEHAEGIRIVGSATGSPGVVLVDAAEPTAYCVAGRPHAIVVSTAAVNTLTGPELIAVLAHEQAHLNGRHHHILTLVRALALSLPRLTLFAQGSVAVAHALEMCADDAAARRHGAPAPRRSSAASSSSPATPT